MTLNEAVKKFVNDFSLIPLELVRKAYLNNPDDLVCINSKKFYEKICLDYWPAMWGTMFSPNDWTDKEWIKNNIEIVEKIGFIIYECDEFEVLLGINSAGHDFYEAYWTPLYLKRELTWHLQKTG